MDLMKQKLTKYLDKKHYIRDEQSLVAADVAEFLRLYPKAAENKQAHNYHQIPRFFSPLPRDDDLMQQRLREEARALFLQKKNRELLSNDELENLRALLEQHITRPIVADEILIDYKNFRKVGSLVGDKCKQFFTPSVFAKLYESDPDGRISINQFLGYVTKKFWLHQTRIGLSLYDGAGLGYLKESDLENYIFELIPTLPQLEILEKSFYSFYVCTAVRKFFFFLDPLRTGKVKITEILASGFLDQLIELRDEELSKDHLETNWFSAQSALRVYGQYLNLDEDHNGMLSKQELSRYGSGTLTDVFLDRVFQECVTYSGEMDYKSYLDFVLALENRSEPQALQYLFRILDIKQKGHLNPFDINYFFRAIQKQLKKFGHEPVNLRDIQDEIYDMVKPADPLNITLLDLINSGHGETVTNILIDLNSFWSHENREGLVVEPTSPSASAHEAENEPSANDTSDHSTK
ncbi:serine threonine- phosphatase 2A regulatory subunit B subunit [Brachionus plicatilis]|uniref:Serine/threonine-protein phosphatase 2A regulatory subunit B'' subunit gamma n=1 Tax=Brachionus plicatilis TaxID=10195 RepID=A0A3M7SMC3_BRAPC|nr:serine threonine- phosphatase 2A regulatory subunit B subunit [Brachionus plicatilis]